MQQSKSFIFFLLSFIFFLFILLGVGKTNLFAQGNSIKSPEEIAEFLKKTRSLKKDFKVSDLELRLAVNFDFDSDKLTETAKKQLDNLAEVLESPGFENLKIELAGHTCDLGDSDYNLELSRRRVKSAADYLKQNHKIEASRLSISAYGESLPLIPGANSEEERAINRRVVTYLQENRQALEKMLREMPYSLGFRWAVFRYNKDNHADIVNYDGSSVLNSGDEYRIFLRPAKQKYVYLFQQDAAGKGEWIFPREEIQLKNPVPPGEFFLPSTNEVFVLDENVGREKIFMVVTDQPAAELEKHIGQNNPELFTEAVTQTVKTRGLKNIRIGRPAESPDLTKNVIIISDGKSNQQVSSSAPRLGIPKENVVNIMAQYREFLMVLEFGHK